MSITLVEYTSKKEFERAHAEVKNLKLVYQIPRGQTLEGILNALRKQNEQGRLYQIGCFIWKPAETTPRTTQCVCFQYVGDNDQCQVHKPCHAQ